MKLFRSIVLFTLIIGLVRDFIVKSNPEELYQIVYTLFVAELAVDLVLRLLNTRAFNWDYKNNPLYSLAAFIVFITFSFLALAFAFIVNEIFHLNLNVVVLFAIPFWAVGKYITQAIVLNEFFLISSVLDLLRTIGLVAAVAQMSFQLAGYVLISYSLFTSLFYWYFIGVNKISYKETVIYLKSIIKIDFKILIQGAMITAVYIVDKSLLNLSDAEGLFLILVFKLCIISTSLLNRAYLHPFHVKFTNQNLDLSSLNSIMFGCLGFAGSCGVGIWLLFDYFIYFLPLELRIDSFTVVISSVFTALFVFREYSIRVLILKNRTSLLGNLGIVYAASLLAILFLVPEMELNTYIFINIVLLTFYLGLAKS